MVQSRPDWDSYFLEIANVIKKRSTCLRRQIGAVIVKDNRILTTGYNGVPPNIEHCDTRGCLRQELNIPSGQKHELCRALHAEQNAITQAAKNGISIDGATIYITAQPCIICTKLIMGCGISRVVYEGEYPDELSLKMLQESHIIVEKYKSID
ncbi:MAG: dCMP deaminase family protein [Clostridium sp.]